MACGNCGARGDTYQLDSYGPDMEGTSQPLNYYTGLEEPYSVVEATGGNGGPMSTSSLALVLLGAMAVGGAVAVVATRNRRY